MNKPQNFRLAVAYAIASAFTGATMNALIKALGHAIDPFTFIFYRNLFAMPILLLWLKQKKEWPSFSRYELAAHFPRAILGMVSYACLLYALQYMKLANANTISLSMPLFVSIFAPFLLKEKTNITRIACVLIGFIGIILILRPDGNLPVHAAIIAIFHPILFAFAIINLRHLSKTVSPELIVFYFAFFSILFSLPWAIFHTPEIKWEMMATIAAVGLLGILLQYTQTKSLELAEATAITPFNYLSIIWSIMIGIIFWAEWPDGLAWAGMALVVSMGLALNFLAKPQKVIV